MVFLSRPEYHELAVAADLKIERKLFNALGLVNVPANVIARIMSPKRADDRIPTPGGGQLSLRRRSSS
jgi:hypothetical protein